jgi:hypothetical protein
VAHYRLCALVDDVVKGAAAGGPSRGVGPGTIPASYQGFEVNLYLDIVVVQVGRVGITATFGSQMTPFESSEAARFTRIVVDRVLAAGAGR